MIFNETYNSLHALESDIAHNMQRSISFSYLNRAKVRDFYEKNKTSLRILNTFLKELSEAHTHEVMKGEGDDAKKVLEPIDAEHEKMYNEKLTEFLEKPCKFEL